MTRWIGILLLVLSWTTPAWAQSSYILGSRTLVGSLNACGLSGGPNAYACTLTPPLTIAPPTNMCVSFIATTGNTGASTLAVNGQTPVPLTKRVSGLSTPLASGDVGDGQLVTACHDGTSFQVQSLGGGAATFAQLGAGTNTAALLVGTGGSLDTTGTGTITANRVAAGGAGLVKVDGSGVPSIAAAFGVNVLDYGATNDDLTDDTTAIQAALTAAAGQTGAGIVLVPAGDEARFLLPGQHLDAHP